MTESPATTIARAVQIVSRTAEEWRLLMEALKDELSRMPNYRINEWSEDWLNDKG